jgi:hypothetical protein
MRIITNFISFLALFLLVGDVLAEIHESETVLSVDGGVTAHRNISGAVPDNSVTDDNVHQHFLDAVGITTENARLVGKIIRMCGIPDNVLLSILLDYECRAP